MMKEILFNIAIAIIIILLLAIIFTLKKESNNTNMKLDAIISTLDSWELDK